MLTGGTVGHGDMGMTHSACQSWRSAQMPNISLTVGEAAAQELES
jgi:hypothetical protein